MPEFSKKININIDDGPEDDIGVASELKRQEERSEVIRKTWIGLSVLILVVGSFWMSFYLGSKILSPVKRLPEIQVPSPIEEMNDRSASFGTTVTKEKSEQVAIPEELKAPPEKAVRASDIAPAIREMKAEIAKPEVRKLITPVVKKAVMKKKEPVSSKSVKVRVAVASDKETADAIIRKLADKGFEAFAKKMEDGSLSVQAGVFKTRSNAQKLAGELKDNGFPAELISE